MRLKVLISAYACEPGRGSEPGVGWNLVRRLSALHDVTVVTRANNLPVIKACGEPWIDRVEWIDYDPPSWLTFWKKGGRGVQLFYLLWQWGAARDVRARLEIGRFDIIHHVTFGKYWIPSPMAGFGVPFVFGPVGGGEHGPPGLDGGFSLRGRMAESMKRAAQSLVGRIPACRRLYRSAAWTFAATPQTESALRRLGVESVSVLPQSGIDPGFGDTPGGEAPRRGSGIRLVTACRLIHWKAVDLAIEAVARLPREMEVELRILQDGPERRRLERLVRDRGVADRVRFLGRLPTLEDVYREIRSADALVHPALHEAFGQACLESLALGTPVICLDWCGPGIIVDAATGFPVRPGSRETTIRRIAAAIETLGVQKAGGGSRREACRSRAVNEFAWSNLAARITSIYHQLASAAPASPATAPGQPAPRPIAPQTADRIE